jgi:regulator of PEP synthase PpsR (kinase-PPPase family)
VGKHLNVFVVSDATGATAEAVVTSVLVQFGGVEVELRRFPFTRTAEQVEQVVAQAPEGNCVIAFTFVSRELSDAMVNSSMGRDLTVIDLLSPIIGIFAEALASAPSRTPGVFHSQSQDMFKVTEAIHYTLQHDDGKGLETLDQADLIILGVSRTGKTPTSIFLSCRKLKVANIPIVRDMPLPEEVVKLPTRKVGFRMDLERQLRLRSERAGRVRAGIPGYAERANVFAELEYCEQLFRRIPNLRTVDVTDRSIEEISDWITRQVL